MCDALTNRTLARLSSGWQQILNTRNAVIPACFWAGIQWLHSN